MGRLRSIKTNQRDLGDKIKRLERKMARIQNENDKQIENMNKEKMLHDVKLNNSLQEMTETKADFDEMVKENESLRAQNVNLIEDIQKIKSIINESNNKSLQLIQTIAASQQILSTLSCIDAIN